MGKLFDKDSFMSTQVKGSNSTRRIPIPEMEALLVAKSVDLRTPKESVLLDVVFVVDEQEARDATGMDEPTVRMSCFLDIDDAGNLEMGEGKNIALGRLREALGQNDEKAPWNPGMIEGAICRGKITQRPDDNDPETIYNDVASVTSA